MDYTGKTSFLINYYIKYLLIIFYSNYINILLLLNQEIQNGKKWIKPMVP